MHSLTLLPTTIGVHYISLLNVCTREHHVAYSLVGGASECVSLLLEHGASVYKRNSDGATPLLIACDAQIIHDTNQLTTVIQSLLQYKGNTISF